MISIKRFLILVSLAAVALVNFIAALHGYRSGLAQTEALLDQQLVEKAVLLSTHVNDGAEVAGTEQFLFQQFDRDSKLVHASRNAPKKPIADAGNGFSTASFNGHLWRVYTLTTPAPVTTIYVAEEISNRYSVAESIVLKTVSPIVIALLALALIIWLVVSLGLQPLKRLTREVASKQPSNLSPIAVQNLPAELRPLLLAMNTMLGRLQESFEREQRFSADAAHELRTPLSALKVNLFNLKKKLPQDDNDLRDMTASIDRMGHLIEQLLMLYRMSSEQTTAHFRKLDLYEIARQHIAENYNRFDARNQQIEMEGQPTWIIGNEFAITAMIANLVDNASKYTPKGGSIKVNVDARGGKACFVVEDSGIGIPAELTGRVLDRFYRVAADGGETGATGCGLGLSIVKHVADIHNASLFMGNSQFPSGLMVEVIFPLAPGEEP